MERPARIVIPDLPYHITQRGNYRQKVFKSKNDREEYLQLIGHYSLKHDVEFLSYCLMDNHVHFIAVPKNKTWRGFLAEPESQEFIDKLRLHTGTGRPLGGDRFVKRIERITGRKLTKKPSGRPKERKRKK